MMNRRMKCKMFFMFCLKDIFHVLKNEKCERDVALILWSSLVYVNVSTASDNRPSDDTIFSNILASIVFDM